MLCAAQGSYYNNPLYDRPVDDEKVIAEHSSFAHPNIWPDAHLPEMHGAFLQLGTLMVRTGSLLARHVDHYIAVRQTGYSAHRLQHLIDTGRCPKGRLLHYFPLSASQLETARKEQGAQEDVGSWCGFHNDHGSLTALTSAMYVDSNGREVPNPDPNAGLYIWR